VKTSRGFETKQLYDAAYRPISTTSPKVYINGEIDPRAITVNQFYDKNSNLIRTIDGRANATTFMYDALNRRDLSIGQEDITISYEYDESNNLTKVIDGENQETSFEYDGFNRRTKMIWDSNDDSRKKTHETVYDALLPIEQKDPNQSGGPTFSFVYDERFRLIEKNSPTRTADNQSFDYDLVGRTLSITHPNATHTSRNSSYTYDNLDRLITETSANITHTYGYDLVGNKTITNYGGRGQTVSCVYDKLNRLSSLTEGGRNTKYYYDLGGALLVKVMPERDYCLKGYDTIGRRKSIRNFLYDEYTPFVRYQMGYDGNGNVAEIREAHSSDRLPSRKTTNTYDKANRLTRELIIPQFIQNEVKDYKYEYDEANNRTRKEFRCTQAIFDPAVTTTVYTYGNSTNGRNSNQLYTIDDNSFDYELMLDYDDNGNLKSKEREDGIHQQFVYDPQNRLLSVTDTTYDQDEKTYTYAYDANTKRVLRDETEAQGAKTTLSFSKGLSVQEYEGNDLDTPALEYIRSNNSAGGIGGLLYSFEGNDTNTARFNYYNSRGDVASQTKADTNSNEKITWSATYEAFGKRISEEGENSTRQRASTKYEEPWGGLNEGYRYRDLDTGVFLTRDPMGFVDGPNVYAYVNQNPWT